MTTVEELAQDLARLDRDVARAVSALRAWRARLAREPEPAADLDPLAPFRHVAGKSTYDALAERTIERTEGEGGAPAPVLVDPVGAPLRAGLRRFVAYLTEARLVRDLDVELARARAEATLTVDVPGAPRRASWNAAWAGVVLERTVLEAEENLAAAVAQAPKIAALHAEREERRDEIARRLGLAGAFALAPWDRDAVREVARAVLDATEDLACDVVRQARRRGEELAARSGGVAATAAVPSPVDVPRLAVARDAPEGWPARLAPRWLVESFGKHVDRAGVSVDLRADSLPSAAGGASFARALEAFGCAMRRGAAERARSLPYVLRDDPWFVDVHRVGAVFGALPASPAFHRRALGTSARVAHEQARVLTRTVLLEVRLRAARALVGSFPRTPRDVWEEATTRALAASAPVELAGAWPAPHDDEPARLVALATAFPLWRELVDRFDEDWFANPRAFDALFARGARFARDDAPAPADVRGDVAALARALEEVLG